MRFKLMLGGLCAIVLVLGPVACGGKPADAEVSRDADPERGTRTQSPPRDVAAAFTPMTTELYLSGLCMFVRKPCSGTLERVTAVFPTHKGHSFRILVDLDNLDAKETTVTPERVYEIPGQPLKQYAVFEWEDDIYLTIDGKPPTIELDAQTFEKGGDKRTKHALVADLGAVTENSKARRVQPVKRIPGTRLALDVAKETAPDLTLTAIDDYPWLECTWPSKKKHRQPVATRALLKGTKVLRSVEIRNGENGAKKIFLTDSEPSDRLLDATIYNLPKELPHHSTKLELAHFPAFYDLVHFSIELPPDFEKTPPICGMASDASIGVKPVACATCQGCE